MNLVPAYSSRPREHLCYSDDRTEVKLLNMGFLLHIHSNLEERKVAEKPVRREPAPTAWTQK